MSTPSLLLDERHRFIRDRLARQGRVLAADLARELGTSEDTIRRDLRELAALGECRRVYRGALPISPASGTLAKRQRQDPERKSALAREAVKLVASGQFVFLDAGSTNLAIAHALPSGADLTVGANSPAIAASFLGRAGFQVLLVGGRMDLDIGAALGAQAVRQIETMTPDISFVGACALDARQGVRAFNFEDAAFKRALAERSRAIVLAATSDKLGASAHFEVMSAADVDHLVVEADASEAAVAPFEWLGVHVHRACEGD
jgi:DeoR/GlpR family transcriptional regulator of sugar metabolism